MAQSQDTCGHHGMVVQVSLPAIGSSTVDLLDFGLELGCHYLSASPSYMHIALLGGISHGSASKEELASKEERSDGTFESTGAGSGSRPALHEVEVWTMVVSSSMCCLAARSFSKDGSWRWMHGWFTAVRGRVL